MNSRTPVIAALLLLAPAAVSATAQDAGKDSGRHLQDRRELIRGTPTLQKRELSIEMGGTTYAVEDPHSRFDPKVARARALAMLGHVEPVVEDAANEVGHESASPAAPAAAASAAAQEESSGVSKGGLAVLGGLLLLCAFLGLRKSG